MAEWAFNAHGLVMAQDFLQLSLLYLDELMVKLELVLRRQLFLAGEEIQQLLMFKRNLDRGHFRLVPFVLITVGQSIVS